MYAAFDKFRTTLNTSNKMYDSVVVFVLSHGDQSQTSKHDSVIYGTDMQAMPVDDMIWFLQPKQCNKMKNKPKLFFIQACRGPNRVKGDVVERMDNLEEYEDDQLSVDEVLLLAKTSRKLVDKT